MQEIGGRTYLTLDESSKYLGVSRTQIFRLLRAGRLATYMVGRKRLVPLAVLDEFIEQNTTVVSR